MAATTQIRADLIINNAKWQAGLEKANKQMKGFGKSMKTVSNGIKGAIAFMGLNLISDGLMNAAKAADEDAASMKVLNKVLVNNWKATEAQTKAIDGFLQATSLQVGIVDDKLRPAFAKIATTIKNPTKAMKVFTLALDVAAGTGKDLNVVSLAMAKFFGGQKSALDKLIPGIKDAGDKIGYMTQKYEGAAIAGAGAFAKINVAVENVTEEIGTVLLPYVQEFAEYLGSKEGRASLQQWIADLKTLITLAIQFLSLLRNVVGVFDFEGRDKATQKALEPTRQASKQFYNTTPTAQQNQILGRTGNMSNAGNVTIVVNAPNVSGPAVVDALRQTARRQGLPLKLLIDRG